MGKLRHSRFVPLIIALGVVVGILIGSFCANHFSGNRLNIINTSSNKLNVLLHLINDQYVDTVNIPDLVEKSLPQILKELDPHSTYVGAAEVEESMQELKGSFSGIGVQFTIYRDTVRVVKVIKGGPSEFSGIIAGDCIISVDGKPFVGKEVTNDETMKRLKGPSETTVTLGIKRHGKPQTLTFSIVRGDVPLHTIDAVYMLDETTGYIRINSFGDTTYPEFLSALAKLNGEGLEGLVIDLRGNLGGYMAPAVQIANEFLPKDRLIVYTEGRKSPREEYTSDGRGTYPTLPLVILVDEGSASASEILAGAVQDNDRGIIVGRRTFGKGLVQVPIDFPDGSMLRLTKARYYTPSGRCVQKPYTPGDEEEYAADLLLRAEHGEYYSADSIKTDGEKFETRGGRVVYGGGGIIPDIFIARDTLGMTSYFMEAYRTGLMFQFAYDFVDQHRSRIGDITDLDEITTYLNRQNVVEQFARFAEKNGLKRRNLMLQKSTKLFKDYLYNYIVGDILDTEGAIMYANLNDPAVLKALSLMQNGETFPDLPITGSPQAKAERRTFVFGRYMASRLTLLPHNQLLAIWQTRKHCAKF